MITEMLDVEARGHWVRLRTLLTLRWVAVAGQAAAVVVAQVLFDLDLPDNALFFTIGIAAFVNLVAWNIQPRNKRLTERDAMLSLLFDLGQVSVLLILTGGLTNPFSALLLAPVTIAASVLTLRSTLILASAAMGPTSLMLVFHRPLVFVDGTVLRPPDLYLLGVWVALSLGIIFMAIYIRRIGLETARMSEALAAAQVALSREQRLTAIGAMAAAAAHELGTPLATIKLISGELARDLADDPGHAEDLALLREQTDRCREILRDLSEGGRDDSHVKHVPITAVLDEAARPHRDRGKEIIYRVNGLDPADPGALPPTVMRRPEIIHGLRNLIQNAVDFAASTIWIDIVERPNTLRLTVGDDGPGFKAEVLDMLGDPYVTTRGRGRAVAEKDGEYQGMGLGLFIAKTLLERSGARLVFANARRKKPGEPTGAVIACLWPRDAIVSARSVAREALGENPRFFAFGE
jgi:two-component system sensor histidine kinase RegB